MKSTFRVLLFLTFACCCMDAARLDIILEISDTYQSAASDNLEDEKLKDFELVYCSKIKNIVITPYLTEFLNSNYGIHKVHFDNVCLEVNAPPPDCLI